jgi:hypothetical protein
MIPNTPITIRYRKWAWPVREEGIFFRLLIEEVTGRPVKVVDEDHGLVDIEFESVYGDRMIPNVKSRLHRFIHSHLPGGIKFDGGEHTPNQQPSGTGRIKIFFTGENERPPEGRWDAYLSFDSHSFGGRNVYLPLWWITSSDILTPTISPYLGREIRLDDLLQPREVNFNSRKKFCVAFIGKAYPFRMHSLTALSKVSEVDVFGGVARNTRKTSAKEKFEISQDYKFVYAFENDLYPGYVTEKAPEAWATGAVPLYWGMDPHGYLNPKAMINCADFSSLETFVDHVQEVSKSKDLWESYASSPFLQKRPNLDEVKSLLKRVLKPLVSEK